MTFYKVEIIVQKHRTNEDDLADNIYQRLADLDVHEISALAVTY